MSKGSVGKGNGGGGKKGGDGNAEESSVMEKSLGKMRGVLLGGQGCFLEAQTQHFVVRMGWMHTIPESQRHEYVGSTFKKNHISLLQAAIL